MSITNERKTEVIQTHARTPEDTGSPEVQIAIMSERIKNLSEHMKEHSKDLHSRRGLIMLVGKRRRLLDYIKRKKPQVYVDLIKTLGIRK
jgi:small subunit ribosomal protein S15